MANITGISINSSVALLPTAYSLQEVTITNHSGDQADIRSLVTDFTITESIYRSSLVLTMNVKDPVNLVEEYQFTGQEKINVILARKDFGSNDEEIINLNFYVSEYPLLGKMNNRLQVYSITAISPFAFISKLKRISRAYSGNIGDFVKGVLITDLGVDPKKVIISSAATVSAKFIVPNMNPLDAIFWALRRAYDGSGSPFYCYQTLNGDIRLDAQTDMALKQPYREYRDGKFLESDRQNDAHIEADYKERARRIMTMSSDFRMSKYIAGSNGAYASTTNYLDLSTKTLTRSVFNYENEFKKMSSVDANEILSPFFWPEDTSETMANYPNSKINFVSTNHNAFNGVEGNYHAPTLSGSINKAQAHIENLDSIIHDISLAGDFKVNSGIAINLSISPSIDPEATVQNDNSKGDKMQDKFFSGKYVVTAVAHKFSEEYTMDLKIKKDSLPFSFRTIRI
jgi:hypothetical protein